MISGSNLHLEVNGHTIIKDVSLQLNDNEVLGIIGPNGAGKSSLLSIFAGLVEPTTGMVEFNGTPFSQIKRRQLAKIIAYVDQQSDTYENITVYHAIEIGRLPHKKLFSLWSDQDEQILKDALQKVNLSGFENRLWNSLSGGEKQRIHIARALAQEPQTLILDEPTNHLDIGHQLEILGLVRNLGLTTMIALHDLNHAAMFCDRIVVLNKGQIVTIGTPKEVLTSELIEKIFHAKAMITDYDDGIISIHYRPSCFLKEDNKK